MREIMSPKEPDHNPDQPESFDDEDSGDVNEAVAQVYDELRAVAARHLRSERPDHTLQPTALVHEAYVRLAAQSGLNWENRLHFFHIASAQC
jgi:hypothetical protein